MRRGISLLLVWCLGTSLGFAQVSEPSLAEGSRILRQFLQEGLPPVLHEQSQNWGNQNLGPKLRFDKGLRLVQEKRNDGTWWKLKVTPGNLGQELQLNLKDFRPLDGERSTFHLFLALPTNLEYEHQIWENGHRLYAGSVRGRLRILIDMQVEQTNKLEFQGVLPDLVFRWKVTQAQVRYDNLVIEHAGGVGGSAARWLGETVRSSLKQWKPSLERDLLARASATIVHAADTKEVRLSLAKVLQSK